MDRYATIGTDKPGKDAMVIAPEPSISLHDFGQRRQGRQNWKRLAWRLITTGPSLMGPLPIVVLLVLLRHPANLLQTLRHMHKQTFILVIPVVPLNKGVLLRDRGE
jgi:hypothetical protein